MDITMEMQPVSNEESPNQDGPHNIGQYIENPVGDQFQSNYYHSNKDSATEVNYTSLLNNEQVYEIPLPDTNESAHQVIINDTIIVPAEDDSTLLNTEMVNSETNHYNAQSEISTNKPDSLEMSNLDSHQLETKSEINLSESLQEILDQPISDSTVVDTTLNSDISNAPKSTVNIIENVQVAPAETTETDSLIPTESTEPSLLTIPTATSPIQDYDVKTGLQENENNVDKTEKQVQAGSETDYRDNFEVIDSPDNLGDTHDPEDHLEATTEEKVDSHDQSKLTETSVVEIKPGTTDEGSCSDVIILAETTTAPATVSQKNEVIEEVLSKIGEVDQVKTSEVANTSLDSVNIEEPYQYTVVDSHEEITYEQGGTVVLEYTLNDSGTLMVGQKVRPIAEHEEETQPEHYEQVFIVEEEGSEAGPTPKKRGRKRTSDIPLHILGHNINKPAQDVPNGKPILKPRLGVKIPYRNLSSQIVSKADLQHEIVERARQKQEASQPPSPNVLFARKLTQRLAKKISANAISIPATDPLLIHSNTAVDKEKDSPVMVEGESGDTPDDLEATEVNDAANVEAIKAAIEINVKKSNSTEITEDKHTTEESTNQTDSSNENDNKNVLSSVQDEKETKDSINKTDESTHILEIKESISGSSNDPAVEAGGNPKTAAEKTVEKSKSAKTRSVPIENNSDLIAILEGDGDEQESAHSVVSKSEKSPSDSKSSSAIMMKEMEREIALKQLRELPTMGTGKNRIFKSREPTVKKSEPAKEKAAVRKEAPSKQTPDKKDSAALKKDLPTAKKDVPSTKKELSSVKKDSTRKDKKDSSPMKKDISDKSKNSPETSSKTGKVPIEVEPQLKPSMVLKTYTRKRKSTETPLPEAIKRSLIDVTLEEAKPEFVSPSPAYITKSSRVIKKKVIWDPDEVPSPVRPQLRTPANKTDAPSTSKTFASRIPEKKVAPIEKKASDKDKEKPTEKKPPVDGSAEAKNVTDKKVVGAEKVVAKKDTVEAKKVAEKAIVKTAVLTEKLVVRKIIPPKKGNKTPVKLKRLSEIDRLLMDEGAVKMLYDVNTPEDQKIQKKFKSIISIERAQKELVSRTKEIKNDLEQNSTNETPKSLRKKETPPPVLKKEVPGPASISRKMSKDSARSSVHSPPASPAFATAEASRIIRRHSSSSFSSSDELVETEDGEPKPCEKSTKKRALAVVDSPKKKIKKDTVVTTVEKVSKETAKKVNVVTIVSIDDIEQSKLEKAFVVTKKNSHTIINLTYSGDECYFTVQMLKDLTSTLKDLGKNKDCNVVSINSHGSSFCLGLDYKGLVESSEDLRRKRATELSFCVREFLKCLLNFPKVLVAGVQGPCVGLGVTMLPLFDMIIASDKASFSTPYCGLGCAPEGGFLLAAPFISNHALTTDLLYGSQIVTADDANRRGLVTKLCWPEKYVAEYETILKGISEQSRQSMEATKKLLRQNYLQTTEIAIVAQTKTLVELWISAECQQNFIDYSASSK